MLWDDFQTNSSRVIHKWEHYFPAYEEMFSSFRNKTITFLEIGCGSGGSLQMWRRYFEPLAVIVGIDINPSCIEYEEPGIHVRIGDQSDPTFLARVVEEFGAPDVVLDDGSHVMDHVNASFDFFYPKMSMNSIYMIEDLHTAYWEEYGGGIHSKVSFINRTKQMIDLLNADHSRGAVPITDFTNTTYSIHIYDSIVAFRKGRPVRKYAPLIGVAH